MDARHTRFGRWHTADDWGLIQNMVKVGSPSPKTEYEAIEGASGSLDLTEALVGDVTYGDRTIEWVFLHVGRHAESVRIMNEMRNAIHGRRLGIVLQDYPGYTFDGRVDVGEPEYHMGYASVTVKATCNPFMMKEPREVSLSVSDGSQEAITAKCGRMPASLKVTATTAVYVRVNGTPYRVAAGSGYELVGATLHQGDNEVEVYGAEATGKVTLRWEWGDL